MKVMNQDEVRELRTAVNTMWPLLKIPLMVAFWQATFDEAYPGSAWTHARIRTASVEELRRLLVLMNGAIVQGELKIP